MARLEIAEDADAARYPPLSSLNHLLFCERRCALLRTEQVWVANRYTVEGSNAHRRVHSTGTHQLTGNGIRVARNLELVSHRLRLSGKADAVEFRPEPFPIETKRGRRRRWDNDDVQLCAQALCLEEMLGRSVPRGAVFHLGSRHRRDVEFDEPLRRRTEEAVTRLHELLDTGSVPPPQWKARCRGCSLIDVCQPRVRNSPGRVAEYLKDLYTVSPEVDA